MVGWIIAKEHLPILIVNKYTAYTLGLSEGICCIMFKTKRKNIASRQSNESYSGALTALTRPRVSEIVRYVMSSYEHLMEITRILCSRSNMVDIGSRLLKKCAI
jgi:hypothetical protein